MSKYGEPLPRFKWMDPWMSNDHLYDGQARAYHTITSINETHSLLIGGTNQGAKHLRLCYNITCSALPQYL